MPDTSDNPFPVFKLHLLALAPDNTLLVERILEMLIDKFPRDMDSWRKFAISHFYDMPNLQHYPDVRMIMGVYNKETTPELIDRLLATESLFSKDDITLPSVKPTSFEIKEQKEEPND